MAFALGPTAISRGYRLAAYETIGSTSSEALERSRAGDPGRLWVVAKAQSAGHGRRGRQWETPSGNLAASLVLALPGRAAPAATLGFAAGLAIEAAIRECASGTEAGARRAGITSPFRGGQNPEARSNSGFREGVVSVGGATPSRSSPPALRPANFDLPSRGRLEIAELSPSSEESMGEAGPSYPSPSPSPQGGGGRGLRLKWPNDVLIDGAKVAGILLEAVSLADGRNIVVVGIGVNVRHRPQGAAYPTISLADCGVDVNPEALFEALAENWVEQHELWNGGNGFADIRDHWLDRAAGVGAPIAVQSGEALFRGTFETIDDEGRLVMRAVDGTAHTISAGEVHFGGSASASL